MCVCVCDGLCFDFLFSGDSFFDQKYLSLHSRIDKNRRAVCVSSYIFEIFNAKPHNKKITLRWKRNKNGFWVRLFRVSSFESFQDNFYPYLLPHIILVSESSSPSPSHIYTSQQSLCTRNPNHNAAWDHNLPQPRGLDIQRMFVTSFPM